MRTALELTRTLTEPPGAVAFHGRDRLNILCLGLDYNHTREGIAYTKHARSDTIFIVSIDPLAHSLNVLSIPRDTRVYIPAAEGYDKINAAYSYGGVQEARKTVSAFLGVPIHHHLVVKVKAAAELVEAVGGLEVDVEKDMDYDDHWGKLHIHLKKGPQWLNGPEVVGYCRFRNDEEGDWGRIRRQQQVMGALTARLGHPTLVTRLQAVVETVRANVDTDLTLSQMVDLACLYHSFERSRMTTAILEGRGAYLGGISYILPLEEANRRLARRLLTSPGPSGPRRKRPDPEPQASTSSVPQDPSSALPGLWLDLPP